jgi:hypothetical protein
MAVAAAPLALATGPVGWVVLGAAVVAIGAVAVANAIDSAEESFPETEPAPVQPCPLPQTNGAPRRPPQEQPPEEEPPRPPPVPPPYIPRWEPDGPETPPTHEEVKDVATEDSNDCGAIAYAIDVLVRDLKVRRWDMQRHGGGDKRHRDTYYLRRESLKRLVERARVLGCPYNPEADEEIHRPHNYPTPRY